MKETLLPGIDRNTASPTESAVGKKGEREHSGADWLNKKRLQTHSRSVRGCALSTCKWEENRFARFLFQCGWYRGKITGNIRYPAPEKQDCFSGAFLYHGVLSGGDEIK